MQFLTRCSPFYPANNSVLRVMRHVLIGLTPALAAMLWLFSYSILIQLFITCSTALCAETLCLKLRKRPVKATLFDLSALVTAVLFALAIPTIAPWWIGVTGTLFAILIGKHVYGGLGYNPFNPAMIGYVFLLISFPLQMTSWQTPLLALSLPDALHIIFLGQAAFEGLSSATVLDSVKTHLMSGQALTTIPNQFIASKSLIIVSFSYFIGGFWLLYQKVISWHIPVALLAGLCGPAAFFYFFDTTHYSHPLFHLLSGATLCGAFFIATDPVSAATSNTGRLIYGTLIGCLIFIIRTWGGYPDAVAFAVLLGNLTAPSIDYWTRPKPIGKQI